MSGKGQDRRWRSCPRWLLVVLPVLVILWVLSVSQPGIRVEGSMDGDVPDKRLREGPLRVLSLNMLHGFPRFEYLDQRLAMITDEVERLEPDIVCLQEVPWRPGMGTAAQYLAKETGLNHVYLRANGNRWAILFEEGEAILSRYPLRDVGFVELAPRAGFFEHRVVLRATTATPWGDVQVFVTHMTHGAPEVNRGQVAALKAIVEESAAGVPAIVAGDFNAPEDSLQIGELGWIDTYRAANPDDPGPTCCVDVLTSGPGDPLEMRIDYVFVLPGAATVKVLESRRVFTEAYGTELGRLSASDHVGVMTDLSLGDAQRAGSTPD